MSKAKFIGDIVHTEKYSDKKTGEEKKKHTKVGGLFQRDDGSFSIKQFDTWLNVYPPKAKEEDYKNLRKNIESYNKPLEDETIPF